MARANVYMPDDLHERARAAGLNVSELAQKAVEHELDRRDRLAAMDAFLRELGQETGPANAAESTEAQDWARWVVDVAQRSSRGDKSRPKSKKTAG